MAFSLSPCHTHKTEQELEACGIPLHVAAADRQAILQQQDTCESSCIANMYINMQHHHISNRLPVDSGEKKNFPF